MKSKFLFFLLMFVALPFSAQENFSKLSSIKIKDMVLTSSKLIEAHPENYANIYGRQIAQVSMNLMGSVMFNSDVIEIYQIYQELRKQNPHYIVLNMDMSAPTDAVDKMVGYIYKYYTDHAKHNTSPIFIMGEFYNYKLDKSKHIVNLDNIPTHPQYDIFVLELLRKTNSQIPAPPAPVQPQPIEPIEFIEIIENSDEDLSTDDEDSGNDRVYDVVDENASFPGGDEACTEWIRANLRYPSTCIENQIHGRVIVSFVVLKNGNLSNIKIVRTPHQELSKEAMRLVGCMPKWIPAQMKGKNVNSNYNLVIRFSLP